MRQRRPPRVAVVGQRDAELDAAKRRLARSEELAPKGAVPVQRLDDDRADFQKATAAVSAAKAQVAAADAAIGAAKSLVVDAEAEVEVARRPRSSGSRPTSTTASCDLRRTGGCSIASRRSGKCWPLVGGC